eukprot:TRINITY_DN4741_c1_g1_i18.p1 TRINITY_DN4741_c1_g1~~TRINITY_DN4741_c1_g1_i18.p1  ORF type:complete len:543 (+),score=126.16 TRINITY_DN4741_c1_g1_i18:187-1815(+)
MPILTLKYDTMKSIWHGLSLRNLVQAHPNVDSWMKYAKFEEKQRQTGRAREVFERAVKDQTGVAENIEKLYVAFAEFEERAKEFDRARAIYRFALDNIPKQFAKDLFQKFTAFEKKHGDKGGIEDVILRKRRFQYEAELKANSVNYDTWFDYVRLEENNGTIESTREVYKRAIAQVPPMTEKRLWRRYIYLWVNYALFEELQAQDLQQAREVYQACIKLIPHKSFSFSKIWILYAHFEVRQMDLDSARKILGRAIGMAPKDKVFRAYIQLELELGNIDRCRILHQKRLEWAPSNCEAWLEFAELEVSVREIERARAIFELAVGQPVLDMPEKLWKGYIDFEIAQGENDRVRALYTRLLELTQHVKVWMSYAQFESTLPDVTRARDIYSKADASMKGKDTRKDERVMLLEAWKEFEDTHGTEEEVKAVAERMPKKIKKRRDIKTEDGLVVGSEEYYDCMSSLSLCLSLSLSLSHPFHQPSVHTVCLLLHQSHLHQHTHSLFLPLSLSLSIHSDIFPDVSDAAPALKLLQMAHKWKQSKMQGDS